MESLTPNLFVTDMTATLAFYKRLGFDTVLTVPDTGEPFNWAMVSDGTVSFMFQTYDSLGEELPDVSRAGGGALLFYLKVKNIAALYESLQHKVPVLKPLTISFYGANEFAIKDNNGFVLTFAEDVE